MELESMDDLFVKPLHEGGLCPWYTEAHFGHSHPCTDCENNEMLLQDIHDDADALIESGAIGIKNTDNLSELQEIWVKAMNVVIRERKEESGLLLDKHK